ncbi:MAG: transporter [Candidatus Rifleibacteriota bacterium]
MKRNTAIVALAAWLLTAPVWAQQGYAARQLKQNGFSAGMQQALTRSADPYRETVDAPEYYGQSQVLPPITVPANGSGPSPQMSLPPITGSIDTTYDSGLTSQVAAPIQRPSPAPVVKSGARRATGGSEIYSQEPLNLPPVTTLPVPSRTALPPISDDTMMMVPLEEAVSRVLACNFRGFTGLIHTTSADVSKSGSFKMGFHSSWFPLDRVYDRVLASGESGDMLELPIFFNYSVTDDLEVIYTIPVIDYTIKSRILWTRDISESGAGDSHLGFKYRIFDNPKYQMRGAFGLDFKFPTGNDDKGLGTGKTDFEIFTAFSKNFEKIVAHLNLGYVMTGDPNTQFYPDGLADKFYYNIGIEYPHTHNVTVMAEVNGEDWGAEGMKVDVTPGLRYTPTENFALEVGVPIAVTNDQRYGYNYRLVIGLTTFFQ